MRPNRDVVQVGRDANRRAPYRSRIARLYRFFGETLVLKIPVREGSSRARHPRGGVARETEPWPLLSGAAQLLVRAGELVVERDKLSVERVGEPKVARVIKREVHPLGQDDGGVEIDRHQ
jgi:hypothetical protein